MLKLPKQGDFTINMSPDMIQDIVEKFLNEEEFKRPVRITETLCNDTGVIFAITHNTDVSGPITSNVKPRVIKGA